MMKSAESDYNVSSSGGDEGKGSPHDVSFYIALKDSLRERKESCKRFLAS